MTHSFGNFTLRVDQKLASRVVVDYLTRRLIWYAHEATRLVYFAGVRVDVFDCFGFHVLACTASGAVV